MLSRLAAIIMAGLEARGKLLGHPPQGTVLITRSPKAKCKGGASGANEIGSFHLCIWRLLVTIRRLSFWMNLIFPLLNSEVNICCKGLLLMMPEIWGLANNIDNDQASCEQCSSSRREMIFVIGWKLIGNRSARWPIFVVTCMCT